MIQQYRDIEERCKNTKLSSHYSPKFCSDVINLLFMLQDLLAVSLKQQGGHTQAVGVKSFELRIKEVGSFFM